MLLRSLTLLWLCCTGLIYTQPQVIDTVVCQSPNDLHALLYHICSAQPLCRELYALAGQPDDAEKFAHQLSLVALFNENETQPLERLFVTHLFPAHWMPYYLVRYNASGESCSRQALAQQSWLASVSVQDAGPGLPFVYAASHMMVVYAQYLGNKQYCSDHNERLQYDPVDQSFHCECAGGKICNNSEATANGMLIFAVVAIILAIIVLIIVDVYSSMQLSRYV